MSADSDRIVMINGEVVLPRGAVVSVYDRGFLYGDSVFEVLRTYGAVPFALTEHVDRLFDSAARVLMTMPLDRLKLADEIVRSIKASPAENSYARVMITRGSGPLGLDPVNGSSPMRVILVEPLSPPDKNDYRNGVALASARVRRATDQTGAAGAKVANYLASLLALHEAKAKGASEALIVRDDDEVLEGTTSNVFLVKDGHLFTPPDEVGILVGITRRYVMTAAANLGIDVHRDRMFLPSLFEADEVFITSTIRELLPIAEIDGHRVRDPSFSLTRRLHREFRRLVRDDVSKREKGMIRWDEELPWEDG